MKYSAHYNHHKISFLEEDLWISDSKVFGSKWIDNQVVFIAHLGDEKAAIFTNVWNFDFFGENDLMMEKTGEKRVISTIHYRYENGFQELSRVSEYKKVGDRLAILMIDHVSYLCDIPSGKAITVSCDEIIPVDWSGKKIFLLKHSLFDKDECNCPNKYYLEYYVDEYGNIISKRLNTFRHTFHEFSEEHFYLELENMKKDCQETLENEPIKLKRSIDKIY